MMFLLLIAGLQPAPSASSASSPTSPPSTLTQAFKREAALLAAEKEALQAEAERIAVHNSSQTAALRAEIATLEARLIEQGAKTQTLQASLANVAAAVAVHDDAAANDGATRALILQTFAALHLPAEAAAAADGPELLGIAVQGLARRQMPQSLSTGFFDHDGTFVDGVIVSWGSLGWGASSDKHHGGPLLPASEGARQVGVDDQRAQSLSQAFIDGDRSGLLPVLLSSGSANEGPALTLAPTTTWERLQRLGSGAVVLVVSLLASLLLALFQLLRLRQEQQSVAAVVTRLAGLVYSNEHSAAAALTRTVRGVSGRFLTAVVDACVRPDADEQIAALAASAAADHQARLRRVWSAGAVVVAVVVVVACQNLGAAFDALAGVADLRTRAVLDALSVGLLPLELLALWSIPFLALGLLLSSLVATLKDRLEEHALRLIDVAASGRST